MQFDMKQIAANNTGLFGLAEVRETHEGYDGTTVVDAVRWVVLQFDFNSRCWMPLEDLVNYTVAPNASEAAPEPMPTISDVLTRVRTSRR